MQQNPHRFSVKSWDISDAILVCLQGFYRVFPTESSLSLCTIVTPNHRSDRNPFPLVNYRNSKKENQIIMSNEAHANTK